MKLGPVSDVPEGAVFFGLQKHGNIPMPFVKFGGVEALAPGVVACRKLVGQEGYLSELRFMPATDIVIY